MMVQNKWNLKLYEVVKEEGAKVTLKRQDGTIFEIAVSEFHSAYRNINK
jgi:hypothetical protein